MTQSVNTLFKYEVGGIESFPFRNIMALAVLILKSTNVHFATPVKGAMKQIFKM